MPCPLARPKTYAVPGEAESEYVYTNEEAVTMLRIRPNPKFLCRPCRVFDKKRLLSPVSRLEIARIEKLVLLSRRGKANGKTIAPLDLFDTTSW